MYTSSEVAERQCMSRPCSQSIVDPAHLYIHMDMHMHSLVYLVWMYTAKVSKVRTYTAKVSKVYRQ